MIFSKLLCLFSGRTIPKRQRSTLRLRLGGVVKYNLDGTLEISK